MTPHVIGVICALTSAVVWGSGDFSGGVAARTQNQFQVLALMSIPGIVVLALLALFTGEMVPTVKDIAWASSAGVAGALGIAALYRALSLGNAATVAPTTAVIGAALPVVFSWLFIGMPGIPRILGFIVAIYGIWCVSRPADTHPRGNGEGLILAVLAGMAFGWFFILIAQVEQGKVFAPLAFSKVASLILALVILRARGEGMPPLTSNPIAILAGFFDAGGNAFYMVARQFTRLDVAVVLASMYPAVTVILAYLILREKISASQWWGVGLCVTAITLISL